MSSSEEQGGAERRSEEQQGAVRSREEQGGQAAAPRRFSSLETKWSSEARPLRSPRPSELLLLAALHPSDALIQDHFKAINHEDTSREGGNDEST